jgi:large subunit ribosomal protein L30
MGKIKITQVKSTIKRTVRQKRTMEALGIRKLHHSVEVEATPQILGMVNKVLHLVTVEEVAGKPASKK